MFLGIETQSRITYSDWLPISMSQLRAAIHKAFRTLNIKDSNGFSSTDLLEVINIVASYVKSKFQFTLLV